MERWREWASAGAAAVGTIGLVAGWLARLPLLRALGVGAVATGLVILYHQADPNAARGKGGGAAAEAPVDDEQHLPWRRWQWQLRGLYSALLFAMCVSVIFQSWEIAWLVTLGLGMHEVGHVLAAWRLGVESEVGFGPVGAWTRTPARVRKALGHHANSLIHLAGPLASLVFALVALGIHMLLCRRSGHRFWLGQANFSALLGVLNLLPMGNLSDGGKFVKRLFASAEERLEQRLLGMVGVLPVIFLVMLFVGHLDWARVLALMIIVLWFALSMLLESKRDEPADAALPSAMTAGQARELLSAMLLMLLIGMGVVVRTPFWLTQEHVEQMLVGLSAAVVYLIWHSPAALKAGLILAILLGITLALRAAWRWGAKAEKG